MLGFQLLEFAAKPGSHAGLIAADRFQVANRREDAFIFLLCVSSNLRIEVLEDAPELDQPRFAIPVNGGDLLGHEIQPRQLLPEIAMVNPLDVIA